MFNMSIWNAQMGWICWLGVMNFSPMVRDFPKSMKALR